jgi:hypothetical protein
MDSRLLNFALAEDVTRLCLHVHSLQRRQLDYRETLALFSLLSRRIAGSQILQLGGLEELRGRDLLERGTSRSDKYVGWTMERCSYPVLTLLSWNCNSTSYHRQRARKRETIRQPELSLDSEQTELWVQLLQGAP